MAMGSGGTESGFEKAPGGIRLRPLDIGDVLDETFRVYRRQFLALITVMAVVVVPSSLLSLLVVLATGFNGPNLTRTIQERGDLTTAIVAGIVLFIVGIVVSMVHLVAVGAATLVASDAILGRTVNVGGSFQQALGRFGSLLLVSIVAGVPVGLLVMTCLGIPVAIFLGLGWALVFPAIMLEGRGALDAMSRSWHLVAGHRWRLLASMFLIGLIVYLLISVPAGLFGFVGGILAVVSGGSPEALTLMQVGNVVFSALGQTLFGAIVYITVTLLYYDLRIRKEAFDIEQRVPLPEAPQVPPYA